MLTALAFLAAFGTGCLLALARHPIYGLVTYVGLLYIHPPSQWWGNFIPSIRWSLAAAVITLFATWIHRSKDDAPPLTSMGLMWGLVIFVGWLVVQSAWALNPPMHKELLVLTTKYTLLAALIYKCIENEYHLKVFLWAHAAGCFYLGIFVFTRYTGGRFEGFESPGIDEANAAALQVATGIIVTFVLFLSGKLYEKIAAVGFMPFILNALVTTISRSGFLALAVAGVLFNLFAPKKLKGVVRIFSITGLILFVTLTNPLYWERIGTILIAGEEVEGVDTGSKRLVLMQAQLQMFAHYPLGCGHRCTAVLSPDFLDDEHLTGPEGQRNRSSHNTFMTLLVEQGVIGAGMYVLLLIWIAQKTFKLRGRMRSRRGLVPLTYTATVAILGAITVGDVFVDYLKFEARVWFLGLLMVLLKFDIILQREEAAAAEADAETVPDGPEADRTPVRATSRMRNSRTPARR